MSRSYIVRGEVPFSNAAIESIEEVLGADLSDSLVDDGVLYFSANVGLGGGLSEEACHAMLEERVGKCVTRWHCLNDNWKEVKSS